MKLMTGFDAKWTALCGLAWVLTKKLVNCALPLQIYMLELPEEVMFVAHRQ